MERKEVIECLENLRLEEKLFKRERESKALSAAIRKMKHDALKKWVMILLVAVSVVTAAWIGVGIGAAEEEQHDIPRGAETTEVYSYVFDGDNVIITTDADHFIRLSGNTVLITDKELPEVEKEIRFVRIMESERQ